MSWDADAGENDAEVVQRGVQHSSTIKEMMFKSAVD
jgi:hypothetical protein